MPGLLGQLIAADEGGMGAAVVAELPGLDQNAEVVGRVTAEPRRFGELEQFGSFGAFSCVDLGEHLVEEPFALDQGTDAREFCAPPLKASAQELKRGGGAIAVVRHELAYLALLLLADSPARSLPSDPLSLCA
jgi:hypothetical protein